MCQASAAEGCVQAAGDVLLQAQTEGRLPGLLCLLVSRPGIGSSRRCGGR